MRRSRVFVTAAYCIRSFTEFFAQAKNKVGIILHRGVYLRKIHIRLQVWALYAIGIQSLRAAGCKNMEEKDFGLFLHAKTVTKTRDRRFLFL